MHLAGLGVDEVGGERARIAPKERVRERAVAPEEPAEVQADEQLRAGVEQAPPQIGHAAAREERPERERVVEMPRDQDGLELVAPFGDHPDRVDDGHLLGREAAQQPVLAPRDRRRQLLERVERRADWGSRTRRTARRGGGFRERPRRAAPTPTRRGARPTAGRGSRGARSARSAAAVQARHLRSWIVASTKAATPPGLPLISLSSSSASAP